MAGRHRACPPLGDVNGGCPSHSAFRSGTTLPHRRRCLAGNDQLERGDRSESDGLDSASPSTRVSLRNRTLPIKFPANGMRLPRPLGFYSCPAPRRDALALSMGLVNSWQGLLEARPLVKPPDLATASVSTLRAPLLVCVRLVRCRGPIGMLVYTSVFLILHPRGQGPAAFPSTVPHPGARHGALNTADGCSQTCA